ncbi:hypothetical protein R6Q59_029896 [Mikania micrantha]
MPSPEAYYQRLKELVAPPNPPISPHPLSSPQPLSPSPFSDYPIASFHRNQIDRTSGHRKTNMAEEQKWQEATTHVLCVNNCGFFGSPTTLNLCSKCYKDHRLKEQQISTAKIAVDNSLTHPPHQSETFQSESSSFVFPDQLVLKPNDTDLTVPVQVQVPVPVPVPISVSSTAGESQHRNRCGSCRKRVGLTGFTCRCGVMFCGTHRYPEKHDCSFDYKTVGKVAIAVANPVVKAEKLEKI